LTLVKKITYDRQRKKTMLHTQLAYLDPGTGSLILQMIVGGIVGALLFFKTWWYKVKNLFTKNNDSENPDDEL